MSTTRRGRVDASAVKRGSTGLGPARTRKGLSWWEPGTREDVPTALHGMDFGGNGVTISAPRGIVPCRTDPSGADGGSTAGAPTTHNPVKYQGRFLHGIPDDIPGFEGEG